MFRTTIFAGALVVAGSMPVTIASADEVIIHRDAPVVEEAPTTSRTTVERHGSDCDSKSVHTENSEGDSKTVTQENCD